MENNKLVVLIGNSGLEETTALAIKNAFSEFFTTAQQWADKAQELVVTDSSQTDLMKQAREARLALKDIRVKADKARKELKADSLKYGNTVQAVYNSIEGIISPIEEHLEKQEKFAEIQRQKEMDELRVKRETETEPYRDFLPWGVDLSRMPEEEYRKLFDMVVDQFAKRQAEQERINQEKIEQERKEAEERERIRLENERLRKENEEKERILAEERKAAEEQAEKTRKEAEERLRIEREAREKAEAEIQAKADSERREAEEQKRAEKKAAAAPDKEKLLFLAQTIDELKLPTLSTPVAASILQSVTVLLNKVTNYIRANTDLL
jgi:Asp-tRNA(Asn)/Glu-tRNA(Gln) amidotransferase A subunit family amidase